MPPEPGCPPGGVAVCRSIKKENLLPNCLVNGAALVFAFNFALSLFQGNALKNMTRRSGQERRQKGLWLAAMGSGRKENEGKTVSVHHSVEI